MRPPTDKEKKEMLISFRDPYIREVSKGKKSKWEELTFWEKRKVIRKCEAQYRMLIF